MSSLSPEKTLGQMIMPRLDFREGNPVPLARRLLAEPGVGGFIVFGGDTDRVSAAVSELQSASDYPLFFGIDAERGVGQIVEGGELFPFAMSLGAAASPELARELGREIACGMRALGLNMLFAPVVDVNTEPLNPIINVRSFGDDPALVAALGRAFIEGAQSAGVIACAKHFPGHGAASVDSHVSLPTLDLSRRSLDAVHLPPFRAAIEAGVGSVMLAHIVPGALDPAGHPATLSGPTVRGLLREELGYAGLVLTDSFRMEALAGLGAEGELAARAIAAGVDIVLDPVDTVGLHGYLCAEAAKGAIAGEVLEVACNRIAAAKGAMPPRGEGPVPVRSEAQALRDEIARRSVCMIDGGSVRWERATVFVLDVTGRGEGGGRAFVLRLEELGVETSVRHVRGSSGVADTLAGVPAPCVFVVCTGVAGWERHTVLPAHMRELLARARGLGCPKALVSLGSPYVVEGMSGFDAVLLGFDTLDEVQRAAAEVLVGARAAVGRCPVKLPPGGARDD